MRCWYFGMAISAAAAPTLHHEFGTGGGDGEMWKSSEHARWLSFCGLARKSPARRTIDRKWHRGCTFYIWKNCALFHAA